MRVNAAFKLFSYWVLVYAAGAKLKLSYASIECGVAFIILRCAGAHVSPALYAKTDQIQTPFNDQILYALNLNSPIKHKASIPSFISSIKKTISRLFPALRCLQFNLMHRGRV